MTTYPDPDDMTTAKRGSDHDRAEAWRILAVDMRAERDSERAKRAKLQAVLERIDAIVFDVFTTGGNSGILDIARVIVEYDAEAGT